MKKIINYLKSIGISILLIIILNVIVTLLQYFNIIKNSTSFFKVLTIIISVFIGSFMLGKSTTKKGYLAGLKLGLIISIIFLSLNLIVFKSFQFKNIIYYLIIIITSIIGSMLGIQKKSSN